MYQHCKTFTTSLFVGAALLTLHTSAMADDSITALVANAQGQIGIGTTAPTAQLDVKGNTLLEGQANSTNTSLVVVSAPQPSTYSGEAMRVKLPTSEGNYYYLTLKPYASQANYVKWIFGVNSFFGTSPNLLTLDPYGNGRVGINTNTPQAAVDIKAQAANVLIMRGSDGTYATWDVKGADGNPRIEVTVYDKNGARQFMSTLTKSGWKNS